MCPSWLGHSVDHGDCGQLLCSDMGSSLWAPRAVVLLKRAFYSMAPLGWAPVLPSQTVWSQSAVFSSFWHLAFLSHACLAVSACGMNVS